jgi:phage-related holin
MNVIIKYLVFFVGCIAAYFEPIKPLACLVVLLFCIDFLTGVAKSVKVTKTFRLKSKKWRWSFVKAAVYLAVMLLTFAVCEMLGLSVETGISAVRVEAWCIVYIEGLSIVENLRVLFPTDKFLMFLHYLLSVEFLKYVPMLNSFLKEKDGSEP